MKKFITKLLSAALLVACAGQLSAAVIIDQNFEQYTLGNLDGVLINVSGLSGNFAESTGVATTTYNATAGTIDYSSGEVSVSGGSKFLRMATATPGGASTASGSLNMTLSSSISASGVGASSVYVSFLCRFGGTLNNGDLGYSAFLTNTQATAGSIGTSSLYGGPRGTAAGVGSFTSGVGSSTASGGTLTVGNVNFVVVEFVSNGTGFTTVNTWVNPSSLTKGAATYSVAGANNTNSFTALSIVGAGLDESTSDYVDFDNLLVGTSWEDVVPVPEPSSFALMAVGGMGLMAVRRRKAAKGA